MSPHAHGLHKDSYLSGPQGHHMHMVSIRTLLNFFHKLCQLRVSSAAVVNLSGERREQEKEGKKEGEERNGKGGEKQQ